MDLRALYRYGLLLVLLVSGLGLTFFETTTQSAYLQVHFLDVGQGDSVLIQTPDGFEVLIDGGASSQVIQQLSAEQSWNDRVIDVVIATHPDTDHVGGLNDVLERYQVDLVVQTEAASDSPAAIAFSKAVILETANIQHARAGQLIQIGASTTIEILSPASDTTAWRANAASIIVRVVYGDTAFMLTGDASSGIEDYLVATYGTSLQSDVLKLGHHGSQTSTSELFLDTVQPQYAVVSASIDNRYGHPNQTVMQRVFDRNITSFHTGTDGTVTFYSDGERVWSK
jgi:competence protein ComEC